MRALNLDQLRTLVAIADLGSFTAASKSLHLAPPTISLHVSELESRLGATLLVRTRAQVAPTRIGERLILRARRLLADTEEAVAEVERQLHGDFGRVKIGASTGALAHVLPKALEWLGRDHAGIDVQVAVLTSQETLEQLRQGVLDIGLIALPQPPIAGLKIMPWRSDPVKAFIPAKWFQAERNKAGKPRPKQISPAWLASQALILNDASTRLYRITMEWFAAAGQVPKPRIELNFNDAMKSLVAAGYGAALLPVEADDIPVDPRILVLPLSPKLWRPLGLAYRDGTLEPATRSVLDVLTKLPQR
jgi:DNA-binding transcriptional LysR family regulator